MLKKSLFALLIISNLFVFGQTISLADYEKELNTSVTIDANTNGLTAGPITLATGVVITVSTGATLVVA